MRKLQLKSLKYDASPYFKVNPPYLGVNPPLILSVMMFLKICSLSFAVTGSFWLISTKFVYDGWLVNKLDKNFALIKFCVLCLIEQNRSLIWKSGSLFESEKYEICLRFSF